MILIFSAACGVEYVTGFGFGVNGLFLVIITQFMKTMMQKYGELIVIVGKHNTTPYGFKLITVMVVDPSTNSEYPVAFCICAFENEKCIKAFLQTVKTRCRLAAYNPRCNINPLNRVQYQNLDLEFYYQMTMRLYGTSPAKYFANLFANISCVSGMLIRTGSNRYLEKCRVYPCPTNSRSKQLTDKVANVAEWQTIYHQLCVLRWERNSVTFEKLLPNFIDRLPETFNSYFT